MNRKIILSTAALLALAACGRSENANEAADNAATDAGTAATEATNDTGAAIENTTAATTDAVTPTPDTNTAAGFASTAAISDMFEIESSRLAAERAKSQKIKDYAQQMIKDHTTSTNELKSTLQQAKVDVTLPTALDQQHQEMLTDLRNASADDFETKYLDQQTTAHQQAVDLHRGYAESGDNPQLKQLAAKMAPIVQQHLDMVKKLDNQGADDTAKAGGNTKQ